jgi:hypothetical protein
LHEQPSEHALVVPPVDAAAPLAVEEDPDVLALPERGECGVVVPGCEEDFDELLGELCAERAVDVAIQDDDAAVRGRRIGRERLVVRLLERRADCNAAPTGRSGC